MQKQNLTFGLISEDSIDDDLYKIPSFGGSKTLNDTPTQHQ